MDLDPYLYVMIPLLFLECPAHYKVLIHVIVTY